MTSPSESASFSISGMQCGGCAIKLEKHLNSLAGITSARANATLHEINIQFNPLEITLATIVQGIAHCGFAGHVKGQAVNRKPPATSYLLPLAVSGFGLMNVMLFSISVWAGLVTDMDPSMVQNMHWAAAAITTPVLFYAAQAFYLPAIKAALVRRFSMDSAITIAIFGTYFASLVELWQGTAHVYFDAALSLTFFLLIGRVLDQSLRRRSNAAAENLRGMVGLKCKRLDDNAALVEIATEEIKAGMQLLIAMGERLPVEGMLLSEDGLIDESIVTGESQLEQRKRGEVISAGGKNMGASLMIEAVSDCQNSSIARLAEMVEQVSIAKGKRQLLADRFARGYAPFVMVTSALAFLLWVVVLGASWGEALSIAVAVLVVTCPCAAGLATPAVVARAANLMLERGAIVQNGAALEMLPQMDIFACDKTGTLSDIAEMTTSADMETLRRAAEIAASSNHPLAEALSQECAVAATDGVAEMIGMGLQGADGTKVGSAAFVDQDEGQNAHPSLWVKLPDQAAQQVVFAENPQEGLSEFLQHFVQNKVELVLLSGDREGVVQQFAETYSLPTAYGGLSPEQKIAYIQQWRGQGKIVGMIGDGLNDVAALAEADVSLSFAKASDATRNAADIVIAHGSLRTVVAVSLIAQQARGRIAENLAFATLYNVLSVPIAIAGYLTPFWAAILMSSSSILVMLNAMRVRYRS